LSSNFLTDILPDVLDEWASKSRSVLYKRDPEAWVNDVLGKKWWSKQAEIAHDYISNPRTAVRSANGTGKSYLVADLVSHWVSVHDPGEVIAIISAPTLQHIKLVVFAYLQMNYSAAKARDLILPGNINQNLEWKDPGGQTLAVGRKPQDKDIVGSFQGVRRDGGTAVFIDEAGSVPRDLFTAAEAVTTGSGDHKIMAIGNPDLRGTFFHDLWLNPENEKFWKLHTISAFDLPTFTGEAVYPDEPERQYAMLHSGMQDPETVESWRAQWGEDSARWQSKVLGEFPDAADNTFFSQVAINTAMETEIEDDPFEPLILGVDIALSGTDETIVYGNRGGRVRFLKSWGEMNVVDGARAIHQLALETGAAEMRIDASGEGGGVAQNLRFMDEFASKPYDFVMVKGAWSSPDETRWNRLKSWSYDDFLRQMSAGLIDLDFYGDECGDELRKELIAQTYDYNNRNALQITPKRQMRKEGLKSPDHLDAVIYATMDLSWLDGPLPGASKVIAPEEVLDRLPEYAVDDDFPW